MLTLNISIIEIFEIFCFMSILSFAFFSLYYNSTVFSIFSLILIFVNAALFLLCQGIEFLSFVLIIVYVGAVGILFVFTLLLLGYGFESNLQKNNGRLITFSLISWLKITLFMFYTFVNSTAINSNFVYTLPTFKNYNSIDLEFLKSNDLYAIGIVLYGEYFYYVILVSLILFTVMVGSISISNIDTQKKNKY